MENGVGKIVLADGRVFLVDKEREEELQEYRWWAVKKQSGHGEYVIGWVEGKGVRVERMLFNFPKGKHLRHINGDNLDFRRENIDLPGDAIGQDENGCFLSIYHRGAIIKARIDIEDAERLVAHGTR